MGSNSQVNNPLLGLVKDRMSKIGIKKQNVLAAKCDVSSSVINRFLHGRKTTSDNIYKILMALDLLKTGIAPEGSKKTKPHTTTNAESQAYPYLGTLLEGVKKRDDEAVLFAMGKIKVEIKERRKRNEKEKNYCDQEGVLATPK